MTATAVCYMLGYGTDVNYFEANSWLRKSISNGDVNANWLLGSLLLEGKLGISSSNQHDIYLEAFQLLSFAANDHNIPQAQHFLALMYEYGLGNYIYLYI